MNAQRLQFLVFLFAVCMFVLVVGSNLIPERVEPAPSAIPTRVVLPSQPPQPTQPPPPTPLVIPTVPLLGISGCVPSAQAAVEAYLQAAPSLRGYQAMVRGVFPWERGAIVLFTSLPPTQGGTSEHQFLHYMLAVEEPCGWRITEETNSVMLPISAPERVTINTVSSFYTLVYGHIRCTKDLRLGIEQQDDTYLLQQTQDGYFAIATSIVNASAMSWRLVVLDGTMPIAAVSTADHMFDQICG